MNVIIGRLFVNLGSFSLGGGEVFRVPGFLLAPFLKFFELMICIAQGHLRTERYERYLRVSGRRV